MNTTRNSRNRAESSNAFSVLQQQGHHNMENAAAEASIRYETRAFVENIRPRNAVYAYLPKQAKYTQRCTEKHDENNIVTELKIVRYVKSILDKGIISKTTNSVGGTETFVRSSYSHEALKMHIKALIDLYNQQRAENQANNAFAAVSINSVKKTHSGRQAGAREAEMAGLSQDHIHRVGQWNRESMENNYLTCLPRVAIRVIGEEWQQKMQDDPSCQTICGEGFLKLLVELRVIILQDAVTLKQIAPNHEMFSHDVFHCEGFELFAAALTHAMDNTMPPSEVQIQRVVPEINSRISELALQMQSLSRVQSNQQGADRDIVGEISSIMTKFEERLVSFLAVNASIQEATAVVSRRRSREDDDEGAEDAHKRYKLSRDLSNVTSLWREWTVGLGNDIPSINSLNDKYGSKWRQDAKERKYYSKRLVIVNEIKKVASDGNLSLEEAAVVVEDERRSTL
ncbi:MAG: transcriptional activator of glycolytic enzymes-domain-containing protein [Benjaminiella poitrasii]|nr:MAG: transcriptional activator of glycolytic enzymes-domain-containing protein [Benjaminiella poitrasii]